MSRSDGNDLSQFHFHIFEALLNLSVVGDDVDTDLLAKGEDILFQLHCEVRTLLLSHTKETHLDVLAPSGHDWFHGRNHHLVGLDNEFTPAGVLGYAHLVVDLDVLVCVDGYELGSELILEDGDFTVPSFSCEETWGHVWRHLEAEREGELSDLALVLVRGQIKQVEVQPHDDSIVTVAYLGLVR